MPRQKLIDRPIRAEVKVPESILSRVDLELFSELEGRVPYGHRSELITSLLREWLEARGIRV